MYVNKDDCIFVSWWSEREGAKAMRWADRDIGTSVTNI